MPGYRRGLRLPGSVVVVAGTGPTLGPAVAAALTAAGARPELLDGVDLTDAGAVRAAAHRVVDRHGRIDGWVQCAAPFEADPATPPGAVGSVTDLSPDPAHVLGEDEVRRVLSVGALGAVHGARAALPHLAARDGGVLVFVVSVHGQVARPFGAPQSMVHAGVRALAGALRQELRLDGVRGVAVTTVLAPALDAGAFPAGRPDRVAATVLDRLRRPGLEKVAGGALAKAIVHGHALVPPVTEWLVAQLQRRSTTQRQRRR